MSAFQTAASLGIDLGPIEDDLASLSCQAAVELDNLVLGRFSEIEAVRRVATQVSDSIPSVNEFRKQSSLLDPTAAVIVNRALAESSHDPGSTTVEELLQKTGEITDGLIEVSRNPDSFLSGQADKLKRLRAFCLALSKHAAAADRVWEDDEHRHPFRR